MSMSLVLYMSFLFTRFMRFTRCVDFHFILYRYSYCFALFFGF